MNRLQEETDAASDLLNTCKSTLLAIERMIDTGMIEYYGPYEPSPGSHRYALDEAIEPVLEQLDKVICKYGGYEYNRFAGVTFTQVARRFEPQLFEDKQ